MYYLCISLEKYFLKITKKSFIYQYNYTAGRAFFKTYLFPLLHFISQVYGMLASGSFKARTAVTTNLATMIGFTHSILLYLFPQTSILLSSPEYSYLLNAISLQACMYLSMLFFIIQDYQNKDISL